MANKIYTLKHDYPQDSPQYAIDSSERVGAIAARGLFNRKEDAEAYLLKTANDFLLRYFESGEDLVVQWLDMSHLVLKSSNDGYVNEWCSFTITKYASA